MIYTTSLAAFFNLVYPRNGGPGKWELKNIGNKMTHIF